MTIDSDQACLEHTPAGVNVDPWRTSSTAPEEKTVEVSMVDAV